MKSNYLFCEKVDYIEGTGTHIATYICLKNVMFVLGVLEEDRESKLVITRTANGYEYLSWSHKFSGKLCNTVKRREEVYR